jgi:DNA-binding NarL/FixJ family response regulator
VPIAFMPPLPTYIVEDSPVIRESLVATLEELTPVQVVGWAADEATALSWLNRPGNSAALLIVDIFLAGGSGLGVLRGVARLDSRPRMVVLSNYATPDMRRKCLELGAEQVFDKSADIDALIDWCTQLATLAGQTGTSGTSGH